MVIITASARSLVDSPELRWKLSRAAKEKPSSTLLRMSRGSCERSPTRETNRYEPARPALIALR